MAATSEHNDTYIFQSYEEFSNRKFKSINGVSLEFAKENPDFRDMNKTNIGCWNMLHCKECLLCDGLTLSFREHYKLGCEEFAKDKDNAHKCNGCDNCEVAV